MSAICIVVPVFFVGARFMVEPHTTLLYLGEAEQDKIRRVPVEIAVDRLRSQCRPNMVTVTGVELFAEGTHTVLTLADRTLKSYRDFLAKELSHSGIRSMSKYAFKPHVTLHKHEKATEPVIPQWLTSVPSQVWIDRPQLWWDGERPNLNVTAR